MSKWYLSVNGEQVGPMDTAQAAAQARSNPGTLAWKEGYAQWVPASEISELCPPAKAAITPPPFPGTVRTSKADEIDYKIFGSEMQFVEVELDPGESAVAEAGAMMYKAPDITMNTIFGDGSGQNEAGGFMGKLLGAGKRLLTGENMFMTVFTHQGSGKAHVSFGAPYPGNIVPVALPAVNGQLAAQKDSFLCAAKGVSIGVYFQKKIMTGLFGGEGFIMQQLDGDGMVFLHAGGTVVERRLDAGEVLHVDTGCLVAFELSVDFDLEQAGGIKTSLFGGEGLFFAKLRGPGRVWLQSLPFSRMAGRMLQAAPQSGGSTGEGSILGSLGNMLDGDN